MYKFLDFEEPIIELEQKIAKLEGLPHSKLLEREITSFKESLNRLIREVFAHLTPWQRIQLARHPQRPTNEELIPSVFTDFVELYGDRSFRNDPAILCGFAKLSGIPVMVIATRKGKNTEERVKCNFGMPHPEGYRKAMHKMRLAEKFRLPIVILVNTPGAYPGIGAEERGQAMAIAENLYEMSALRTPISCIITGEGFSGGALAIGVADRLSLMENAVFSVISPEGCAAILLKDGSKAPEAAEMLKLTAEDLFERGIADEIIPEPLGGAHRNPAESAEILTRVIQRQLSELLEIPLDRLLEDRYQKYRHTGVFLQEDAKPVPLPSEGRGTG
jgi:acetyl-CoA carboxylase carboxyl transferase subunit alpha